MHRWATSIKGKDALGTFNTLKDTSSLTPYLSLLLDHFIVNQGWREGGRDKNYTVWGNGYLNA